MKNSILALLLLLAPVMSKAAAYWMEVKGSGKVNEPMVIRVCYGHIDEYSIRHRDGGKELELTGGFKIRVIDDEGKSIDVPIALKSDCWEGVFKPKANGRYRVIGINDSHPVVDRSKTGGKNVRPIDYLCSVYRVGTTEQNFTEPRQFLDITTYQKDSLIYLKAFNNSSPAKKAKLRVFNPENWEKELETDDKGEAFFKPTIKGLYIIRQDWDDGKTGSYKGVDYTGTRYRCNYCIQAD